MAPGETPARDSRVDAGDAAGGAAGDLPRGPPNPEPPALAAGIAFGRAALAQAGAAVTVKVPCSSAALAAAITAGTPNETLGLLRHVGTY